MTETKRTEIGELGEFGLIQRLTSKNTKLSDTIKSIGEQIIQKY